MPFTFLAVFFGFALFAATSSVIVLATAEPEHTWLWWSALLPVAVTHWVSGFLATWKSSIGNIRLRALVSATTTILAIIVSACGAYGIRLWIPRQVAVETLIAASIAGLFGLALAIKLRKWPMRLR